MQKRNSIVSIPMLIGIVLSIALHGAALYGKSIYTPPMPSLEQGRTVIHLTLVPSMASQAATAESPAEKPAEMPAPIPVETAVDSTAVAESSEANAMEQIASSIEEKGVEFNATLSGTFRPSYPRMSRKRGETGTVMLSIQVLADGSVGTVKILQSSGYRRLDEAALQAARKTTFIPATRFGWNLDSETELSFTFRLTDD